jgi:hypothetical protein
MSDTGFGRRPARRERRRRRLSGVEREAEALKSGTRVAVR